MTYRFPDDPARQLCLMEELALPRDWWLRAVLANRSLRA